MSLPPNDKEDYLSVLFLGSSFNQGKKEHNYYLLRTIRFAKMLLILDNLLAIATCFLWFIYPVYLHVNGISVDFTIWLPYDGNRDP